LIFILLSITFDKLVAAVENQAIPLSYVKEVAPLYPGATTSEITRKLVEERVLYRIAREESIVVTQDEVEDALQKALVENPQLQNLVKEGLEKIYIEEVRYQLYIQKLLQKKVIPHINITRKDIEDFYNTNRDSLVLPPSVSMEKLSIEIGKKEKVKLIKKAEKILKEMKNGTPFETLAERYSEDPSTKYAGGKLGDIPITGIPPYFNGVDTLETGKVGIFTSPLGIHIIRLNSRTPMSLNLSHIFLGFKLDDRTIKDGYRKAGILRKKWLNGDTTLPIEKVGPIPVTLMNSDLKSLVDTLRVGEISKPILEGNTMNIIRITEKKQGGIPPLKEIQDKIYNLLFSKRVDEEYRKLVEEASEKVFFVYLK